jgi:hypothetical protein
MFLAVDTQTVRHQIFQCCPADLELTLRVNLFIYLYGNIRESSSAIRLPSRQANYFENQMETFISFFEMKINNFGKLEGSGFKCELENNESLTISEGKHLFA